MRRQSFNSNDFQSEEEPAVMSPAPAPILDGAIDTQPQAEAEDKRDKRKDKRNKKKEIKKREKERQSLSEKGDEADSGDDITAATPGPSKSELKIKKKNKKNEDEDATEQGSARKKGKKNKQLGETKDATVSKELGPSKNDKKPGEPKEVQVPEEPRSTKKDNKNKQLGEAQVDTSVEKPRSSKKKDKKEKQKNEKADTTLEEPRSSKKKRKRESEVHVATPVTPREGLAADSLVNADQIDKAWSSTNDRDVSNAELRGTVPDSQEPKKKKKKKNKSSRKSAGSQLDVQSEPEAEPVAVDDISMSSTKPKVKKLRKSGDILQPEEGLSVTDSASTKKSIPKLDSPKTKAYYSFTSPKKTMTTVVTPKTNPSTFVSPKKTTTPTGTPRKTPIPPPQLASRTASRPLLQRPDEPTSSAVILVPETPPTMAAEKPQHFSSTPVPFKLPTQTSAASTSNASKKAPTAIPVSTPASSSTAKTAKSAKKEQVTIPVPTATLSGTVKKPKSSKKAPPGIPVAAPASSGPSKTPKSAPAKNARKKTPVPLPTVPNALTDANLSRHTEPLNDKSKPKPRSKSILSEASSSQSNNSIRDMFMRASKQHSQSGDASDPIVDADANNSQAKKREEPSANVFNEKFRDLQNAVVFPEEHEYLSKYLIWGIENEAVPLCLGTATGCTAKKEEILRLGKEENMNIRKFLDIDGDNPDAIIEAAHRTRNAEECLMLATYAKIPVPIGTLKGTWTLYCPKYAETHFDKYGYGQRTLTITPIAGFKHRNSYTARLNIPPRSMAYTILTFSTPPHASFRTTTIKTAAEGYTMDVIFLGNGYLQMRVDLKLLLKGKATEEVEGKKMHMEFIGVHENAVHWWKDGDNEEGSKEIMKHDGGEKRAE
jgi:hypothetical protein